MKNKICCICKKEYSGYGNNAQPIEEGQCCDKCNRLVLRARLDYLYSQLNTRRSEENE